MSETYWDDPGAFLLSKTRRPVVVAELGINHGGDLSRALAMANAAIDAGAEVIKHQTHCIEDEMSKEAGKAVPGNSDKTIVEIIRESSLTFDEEQRLHDLVRSRGAQYVSTPFSRRALEFVASLEVPFIKIGSGECTNLPFLELAAQTGKPLVISTGMANMQQVDEAVEVVSKYTKQICLLHCTNVYPTPDSILRLGAIRELSERFPDLGIGYSDHSPTIYPAIASIAYGASIIEKHFTDTRRRRGPDISASMTARELTELLRGVNAAYDACKGSEKYLTKLEQPTANFAWSSVVAVSDIKAGDVLSEENIFPMRPYGGQFGPKDYYSLLGKRAKVDIEGMTQLPAGVV